MNNISFDDLPENILILINRLCNDFEESWASESARSIESLLKQIEERFRPVLAAELIALDAELRDAAGQQVLPTDYTGRFPGVDAAMLSVIVSGALRVESADDGRDTDSHSQAKTTDSAAPDVRSMPPGVTSLSELRRQLVAAAICSDQEITQMIDDGRQQGATDERTMIVEALRGDSRITDYQADVLVGRTPGILSLGEYTLLEQLGVGGMGMVYKAVHRRMHRIVALKLVRSDYQRNRRFRERFEREVRAAGRLNHPGIVTAFDAGEADGIPYLVTEYIPAHDLSRIVKDSGPLSVEQSISVLRQTAEALEYAHQKGVIHRDIKPGNLLLDHSGTVKVLDVGLSRLVLDSAAVMDDRPDITNTGFVMGTAEYMAPEQAVDGRNADERSDIYSLGCTLFTLLSGRPCYPADTPVARVLAHREEPVPKLTAIRSDVPEWLQEIFERMVAKSAEDRFSSMTELLRAIASAGSSDIQPVRSSNPAGRTATSVRTRPQVLIPAVTVVGLLLLTYFAGGFNGMIGESPNADVAPQAEQSPDGTGTDPVDGAAPIPPPAVAPFTEAEAVAHQQQWATHLGVEVSFVDELTGIEFVLIPPGRFTMGTTDNEIIRVLTSEVINDPMTRLSYRSEVPPRLVDIERPFYLARTETTFSQFKQFIDQSGYSTVAEQEHIGYGMRDGYFETAPPQERHYCWNYFGELSPDPNDPVFNITWLDATEFCRHYNKAVPSRFYRLPYEQEWEFACRAGTESAWSCGDDQERLRWFAVYFERGRTGHSPAEQVGQRKPNSFGLFDMHGNVSEWCQDIFEWRDEELKREAFSSDHMTPDDSRQFGVVRGGSVNSEVASTRSAARSARNRYNSCESFRVVLEIPEAGL